MATVMIVDDSRTMRKMLAGALKQAGYEVVGDAGNGEEALKLLESVKPDLITLDITMPVMDGMTTLEKIKERDPSQKVIMVSAAGQKDKVIGALKIGALDFIQKPFDEKTVLETVNRILPL
ncbi:MAG: response regulator [Lachnospiraceae bacterium]|nr:response regulator [Lachnospiraceae bacterium]MBR6486207.1 response regulator [Lachnospiraceae bacterium]